MVFSSADCRNTHKLEEADRLSFPGAPIILISIDTLRSDHLPAYGYEGVATPNIDRLRQDGMLFQKAYSHCPLTLPAHAALLTGRLPSENGVRNNIGYRLNKAGQASIPGALKGKGYATAAAVSAYVLRADTGFGPLFDFYDDRLDSSAEGTLGQLQRRGADTVKVSREWIGQQGTKPFFFFMHLFEPHSPYLPPEPFRTRYSGSLYDGEIAVADALVGELLDDLRVRGIYDRAIIILLSDHGEGLGDHGEDEHGIFLYREAIQVPLILKLPGSRLAKQTVTAPVQLIDLFPTISQLTGAALPEDLAGTSLLRIAARADGPARKIFSESLYARIHLGWSDLRSLIDGEHHYIEAPTPELYDVNLDPGEKLSIWKGERRVLAAMRNEIARYERVLEMPSQVDPEEAAKLAALGYLGSTASPQSGALPDPKDRIGELTALRAASRSAAAGDLNRAIGELRVLLGKNPRLADGWTQLARAFEATGRHREAIDAYRKGIEVAPSLSAENALALAGLYLNLNDLDQARSHAQLGMTADESQAHLILGRVALALRDLPTAESEAQSAEKDTKHAPAARVLMAQIYAMQRRLDLALDTLRRAEEQLAREGRPPEPLLNFVRGDVLAKMGKTAAATRAFETEIRLFPRNTRTYANLAVLHYLQGDREAAQRVMETLVSANPGQESYTLAARTSSEMGDLASAQTWQTRGPRGR